MDKSATTRRKVVFGATFATFWRSNAVARATDDQPPAAGSLEVVRVNSPALGEQRRLTFYKPPGWQAGVGYPIVFAADGQFLMPYIRDLEALILAGTVPPMVMAGMWSAEGRGGGNTRSEEYLPGFGDARRHAHFQRYFLEEVVPFAALKLGASTRREDRMLFGFSDGAAWALTTALAHPDQFGAATALSIGWEKAADDIAAANRLKLYFGIGSQETSFKTVTTGIVRKAQRAGGDVVFRTGQGGHEPRVWRPMFKEAASLYFGGK